MRKAVTTLFAASALAFLTSAANAECFGHNDVTATNDDQSKQAVSLSTYDGPVLQPTAEEQKGEEAAVGPECADGEKDCTPATK